jgi:hypothetical protein
VIEPAQFRAKSAGDVLASDSPDPELELAGDDQAVVYCAERWGREFGERAG